MVSSADVGEPLSSEDVVCKVPSRWMLRFDTVGSAAAGMIADASATCASAAGAAATTGGAIARSTTEGGTAGSVTGGGVAELWPRADFAAALPVLAEGTAASAPEMPRAGRRELTPMGVSPSIWAGAPACNVAASVPVAASTCCAAATGTDLGTTEPWSALAEATGAAAVCDTGAVGLCRRGGGRLAWGSNPCNPRAGRCRRTPALPGTAAGMGIAEEADATAVGSTTELGLMFVAICKALQAEPQHLFALVGPRDWRQPLVCQQNLHRSGWFDFLNLSRSCCFCACRLAGVYL